MIWPCWVHVLWMPICIGAVWGVVVFVSCCRASRVQVLASAVWLVVLVVLVLVVDLGVASGMIPEITTTNKTNSNSNINSNLSNSGSTNYGPSPPSPPYSSSTSISHSPPDHSAMESYWVKPHCANVPRAVLLWEVWFWHWQVFILADCCCCHCCHWVVVIVINEGRRWFYQRLSFHRRWLLSFVSNAFNVRFVAPEAPTYQQLTV